MKGVHPFYRITGAGRASLSGGMDPAALAHEVAPAAGHVAAGAEVPGNRSTGFGTWHARGLEAYLPCIGERHWKGIPRSRALTTYRPAGHRHIHHRRCSSFHTARPGSRRDGAGSLDCGPRPRYPLHHAAISPHPAPFATHQRAWGLRMRACGALTRHDAPGPMDLGVQQEQDNVVIVLGGSTLAQGPPASRVRRNGAGPGP